jgi:hypothetical protein
VTRAVRITTPEHHRTGYIELDGQPINDAVRTVTLDMAAGLPPRITLGLAADLDLDIAADVVLPPAVHALLIDLGWTPPEGGV